MLRLIALILILAAPAVAQDYQYFYTRQNCGPAPLMMQEAVITYNEKALFTAIGMTFGSTGVPYTGGSMFLVNQDTGTWTLLTIYEDGTACVTAVGGEFEPFVE